MAEFDPGRILDVLAQHRVRFIVIGGIAASLQGSSSLTDDLDICYLRSPENLAALVGALRSLHAAPRGIPEDLPFVLDATTLQLGDTFIFTTDAGAFDCLATPSGTQGYADLLRGAVEMTFYGHGVKVAGLDDLMRMKRAAGRPKDRVELEILGALRDELDGEP
jgi:hypothetical protein